jgi:hypothetical protein
MGPVRLSSARLRRSLAKKNYVTRRTAGQGPARSGDSRSRTPGNRGTVTGKLATGVTVTRPGARPAAAYGSRSVGNRIPGITDAAEPLGILKARPGPSLTGES